LFVHDIDSAICAFCPNGTGFAVGDRIGIYDEKAVFGRQVRERLVEVDAVKLFRSNDLQIALGKKWLSIEDSAKIAADSALSVEILLNHRTPHKRFDRKRPPVVVFFTPCP
jgi:hypothetical protein